MRVAVALLVGGMNVSHSGVFVCPLVPVHSLQPGLQPWLNHRHGCPFVSGRPPGSPAAQLPFGPRHEQPEWLPTLCWTNAPSLKIDIFLSRALRGSGLVMDECPAASPSIAASASGRIVIVVAVGLARTCEPTRPQQLAPLLLCPARGPCMHPACTYPEKLPRATERRKSAGARR